MGLFPTEKFEFETGMTREEVVSRLRNVTGKRRFFDLRREKPFEGEVSDNEFRIHYVGVVLTMSKAIKEIIGSRWVGENGINEQAIEILGNFNEKENRTIVSLKLTPIFAMKVFLIAWIAVIIPASILYIISFLHDSGFYPFFLVIPVALLLIACWGQLVIFKSAIRTVKALLTAILKEQE